MKLQFKIILAIFFIGFVNNTFTQTQFDSTTHVVIDTSISKQFYKNVKKLTSEWQEKVKVIDEENKDGFGIVLVTKYEKEILKKLDKIKDNSSTSNIKLIKIDPITLKKEVRINNKKPSNVFLLFCNSSQFSNVLTIKIGNAFFNQSITNYIRGQKVATTFFDSEKYDSVFKQDQEGKLRDFIIVSAQNLSFEISDTTFEEGKILYGIVEIITQPYYIQNEINLNYFDKVRWRIKYYFKLQCPIKHS